MALPGVSSVGMVPGVPSVGMVDDAAPGTTSRTSAGRTVFFEATRINQATVRP